MIVILILFVLVVILGGLFRRWWGGCPSFLAAAAGPGCIHVNDRGAALGFAGELLAKVVVDDLKAVLLLVVVDQD